MSVETEELRRLARIERDAAWQHAKCLPGCAGDAVSAFVRRHPVWAMSGAAALSLGLITRHRRKVGTSGKPASWLMALAAIGAQLLPDVLRIAGLTAAKTGPTVAKTDEHDSGENGKLRRDRRKVTPVQPG